MQRELAEVVLRELGRPASEATVTAVDVAPDLSHAKIFVTHHGGAEAAARSLGELNHYARRLRRSLASRMRLRVMPQLRFVYDDSLDRGCAMDALLRRIEHGRGSSD